MRSRKGGVDKSDEDGLVKGRGGAGKEGWEGWGGGAGVEEDWGGGR